MTDPTRYDQLDPIARALVDDHDELDLAEMLVKAQDNLAALRQVSRGYCPACGRGDAAPSVADWEQQKQRADEAEDLLRIAHDTSNKSEAERARAVQRAERAEQEAEETASGAALAITLVRGRAERAEAAIARARECCLNEQDNGNAIWPDDLLGILDEPGPEKTAATQPARCTCTGTSAGLNACTRCPTPWPDIPGATRIRHDDEPLITLPTVPREHCGHTFPQTLLTSPRTECVLPLGHQGSHADDRGCRWWPIADAEPTEQRADRAIALLHDILYASHFTGDRIAKWRGILDQLTDKEN